MLFASGAYRHELGGHPDEAAHYVTGLMIHDYVASGAKAAPIQFAREYYGHFPKVAFGIWPPLFHMMEAAWMALFSASKTAIVLMLGLITATLAFLLFRTVERQFGYSIGLGAALLLITVPVLQQATGLIMVDSTVALFSFLAMLRFARYLDGGRWQDAALFGIWSAGAILAKYNGALLVFLPLVAFAIAGRWRLLLRWQTWLPAGIVALLCGPWYLLTWKLLPYAAEPQPTFATIAPVATSYAEIMVALAGAPILIVAIIGVVARLGTAERRSAPGAGIWVASAALAVACWIFHLLVSPFADERYMLPLLAPLILFLAAGIEAIGRRTEMRPMIVATAVLMCYFGGSFAVRKMPRPGYGEVAEAISRKMAGGSGAVMVDGSPQSEGMMVSEVATRDRARHLYVFRGSKLLATSTWMGEKYHAIYTSPEAIQDALARAGVSVVVLDSDTPVAPHRHVLEEALEMQPRTWEPWADPSWKNAGRFRVYRRTGPPTRPSCVEVSLEYTFHGDLTICPPARAAVSDPTIPLLP